MSVNFSRVEIFSICVLYDAFYLFTLLNSYNIHNIIYTISIYIYAERDYVGLDIDVVV